MATHLEESLQRDIDRIRKRVTTMAEIAERSLEDCVKALQERNRQLAYTVVLRDRRIDEFEKEIDRLCLEFIVRQQPVAQHLRFAYATIRINLELERVGDYAESIARQILKLIAMNGDAPAARFTEIANLSIPMLRDAVRAFVDSNTDLARKTMEIENTVDGLKSRLNADLVNMFKENKMPFEAVNALMMINRHFERVSDQARNICIEVLYLCTGENARHQGAEAVRLLFVDNHNSCRSQMAEGVANSLGRSEFVFGSAGLAPRPLDPATIQFLKEKGIDISHQTSKGLGQVPNLEHYHIIVGLAPDVHRAFPPPPRKSVFLDWSVVDPSKVQGTPEQIRAAFEATYEDIRAHIHDLVEAVLGEKIDKPNTIAANQ